MLTAGLLRRRALIAAIAALALGPELLELRVARRIHAQPVGVRYRVLAFSRTAGFRHDSIPDAISAVRALGDQNRFLVDATEDPSVFTDSGLAGYSAVIFLLTTGDVLDASQQAALERYIQAGNGFVGVHSAADTEYDWPWYGGLVGAYFASHPDIQTAVVDREDVNQPSAVSLPDLWVRTDEWYNFQTNPRDTPDVHVLASLDETSYSGGTMGDHPTAWYHSYDGGRAWYTAGGHTSESYSEPLFLAHVLGGIEYAAGGGSIESGWIQQQPGRASQPLDREECQHERDRGLVCDQRSCRARLTHARPDELRIGDRRRPAADFAEPPIREAHAVLSQGREDRGYDPQQPHGDGAQRSR